MQNNFQVLIDFIVNLKADNSKLSQMSGSIEKILSGIKPEISLDTNSVKNEINGIVKLFENITKAIDGLEGDFKSLNVDFDAPDIDNFLSQIDMLKADLKDLSNVSSIDKLGESFESINFDDIEKAAEDLVTVLGEMDVDQMAKDYDKMKESAVTSYEQQVKYAAKLKLEGKENTDEYKEAVKELNKRKAVMEDIVKTENSLTENIKNTNEATKKLSLGDKFNQFNEMQQGLQNVANTMNDFVSIGNEYESSLAAVGAITGQSGEKLNSLGEKARDLAKSFGGSATAQLSSFQGILSKMGAQVADTPEALAKLATNVNTLSAASGDDAATSMNAIVDSMLQFGLVSGDANKDAETSTRIINALAASAQVGAAEIPQVAQAILAAGVAAKGAKQSFEDTNAAIQVLAVGGKTGAEAGNALRNVMGLLQKASGPAEDSMKKMGTSSKELGEILTTQGLDKAMEKLKNGMNVLGSDAEKNAALMDIFGMENAAAAGILMDNLDKYSEFKKGIIDGEGGIGAAFDQANTRMNTASTTMSKMKAAWDDVAITITQTVGPAASAVVGFTAQIGPQVTAIAGLKTVFGDTFKDFDKKFPTIQKSFSTLTSKLTGEAGMMSKLGPLMMNPWVLGSAAAVGALTLFFTKTEKGQEIAKKVGAWFEDLWQKMTPLMDGITEFGSETLNVLGSIGELIYEYMILPFELGIEIISTIIDTIAELASGGESTGDTFKTLGSIFETLASYIGYASDAISNVTNYLKGGKELLFGLIRSLPELLKLVGEYATEYLNPANWFGDREQQRKALSDKFSSIIDGAVNGAKTVINNNQADLSLDNMLKIKGKLDENGEIDKLLKKYNETTDEIGKKEIAEQISAKVPGAVKGYRDIIDAQGNVIKTMDLNIGKVEEYSKSQKDLYGGDLKTKSNNYISQLKEQAEQYSKNKVKISELAKQIVENSKQGIDVSAQKKEYESLTSTIGEQGEKIKEQLSKASSVGIDISTVKLGDGFEEDFGKELEKLGKKANEAKISEMLTKSIQLKGNLDSNNKIGELVNKFENAKTELEKSNIAKEIQKQVPGAVKAVGTIKDAQGNLITQYEVSAEKAKVFGEEREKALTKDLSGATKGIVDDLEAEGAAYSTFADKLKAKQAEINEKMSKGIDTSKEQAEYDKLLKKQNVSKDLMIGTLKQSEAAGLDTKDMYENVAKTLGLSTDEVKKLVTEQKKSTDEAKNTKKTVDELGSAFNEALGKAKSSQTSAVAAYAKAIADLKKAEASGDKDKVVEAQKELNRVRDEGHKQYLAGKKDEKLLEESQKKVDKEWNVSQKKEKKNIFDEAMKTFEVYKQELQVKQDGVDLERDYSLLLQGRTKNSLDDLAIQNEKLTNIEKEKEKFVKVFDKFAELNQDGKLVIKPDVKLTDEQKQKLLNGWDGLNNEFQKGKNSKLQITSQINIDKKDLSNKLLEYRKSEIEFKLQFGIGDKIETLNIVQDELKSLQDELNEKILKLNSTINPPAEAEIFSLNNLIVDINTKILNKQKELQSKEKSLYDDRIKMVDENSSLMLDRIKKNSEEQSKIIQNTNNLFLSEYSAKSDKERDKELNKIQTESDQKLKQLEEYHKNGLLATEEFEKEKLRISKWSEDERVKAEEEARQRQLRNQAFTNGILKESTRQNEIEIITAEKKALEEKISIWDEKIMAQIERNGFANEEDIKAREKLSENLSESNRILSEKTDLGTSLMFEAGSKMGDAVYSLFAGNSDKAIDSVRELSSSILGVLSDMLIKKVEGAILSMILDWFALTPMDPISKLLIAPITHQLVSGGIHLIADPIINKLLAFPTGGSPDDLTGSYNSPTAIILGDGARLGGKNKEWWLRDEQLIGVVSMAVNAKNEKIIEQLKLLNNNMNNLNLEMTLRGEDLYGSLNRTNYNKSVRSR